MTYGNVLSSANASSGLGGRGENIEVMQLLQDKGPLNFGLSVVKRCAGLERQGHSRLK
jgi:hypothetical protein